MIVNDLLVKFKNGYVHLDHLGSIGYFGHRQGTLELGSVDSEQAAVFYGRLHLDVQALPQSSLAVDYQPRSLHETPYFGFVVGDRVTALNPLAPTPEDSRVVSISVSEDAEGQPIYGLEVHTKLQDAAARIGRMIRKASTLDQGTAEYAQKATINQPSPQNIRPPEWPPMLPAGIRPAGS